MYSRFRLVRRIQEMGLGSLCSVGVWIATYYGKDILYEVKKLVKYIDIYSSQRRFIPKEWK